jgi:hypothetical protein
VERRAKEDTVQHTGESDNGTLHPSVVDLDKRPTPNGGPDTCSESDVRDLDQEVEYVVDECFFTVGQVVGMRTTIDYDVVRWWREHYRARFLAAMKVFGNRWLQDRANVTSVAIMLAERAVRYSEGRPSIDCEAAQRAAEDVERYCTLQARRKGRAHAYADSESAPPRIAGYWCIYAPEP